MYCEWIAYDGTKFETEDECQKYEESLYKELLITNNAQINRLTSKSDDDHLNCKANFNRVESSKKEFIKALYQKEKTWRDRATKMYNASRKLLSAINNYDTALETLHNARSKFNQVKEMGDK